MSLTDLARHQLATARSASSGRSAHTLHGGRGQILRQTVLALAAGHALDDHDNPWQATVQILHGRVRLRSGTDSCEAVAGDLLVIPEARHALDALEDSAVLLTIALPGDLPKPTSENYAIRRVQEGTA